MTAIERGRSIQQRQSMLISTREPIDIRKKIRLMNLKNYIIKYTFNIKEIKHGGTQVPGPLHRIYLTEF